MQKFAIAAAILLLPVSLNAQWLDWRTPDIPRTADGKPNLTAALPRTPAGKPDLTGLWRMKGTTCELRDESKLKITALEDSELVLVDAA